MYKHAQYVLYSYPNCDLKIRDYYSLNIDQARLSVGTLCQMSNRNQSPRQSYQCWPSLQGNVAEQHQNKHNSQNHGQISP